MGKVTIGATPFMEDVSIKQRKEGAVSLMLNARKAEFISSSDVRLLNLTMVFPEKGLTLVSDRGLYNMKDKRLRIDGGVRASTSSYTINASSGQWDSVRKELTSSEKVTIDGQRFQVQGDGLEATTDRAKLTGNVKAVFYGK